MNDVNLFTTVREHYCLNKRRVSSANNGYGFIDIERAVTNCAERNSVTDKLFLAGKSKQAVARSGCDYNTMRHKFTVVTGYAEDLVLLTDTDNLVHVYLRTKTYCLINKLVCKLVSAYLCEAGIVFNFRGKGHLTSEHPLLNYEDALLCAARVNCRRKSRRTCAHNNYIIHDLCKSFQK